MSHPRLTSRQVFDEHATYVFRVLRYLGVREADLQDVCQEVFITVHRKIDSFEGRSSIRTWLYRISQRAASDYRRRAYVRREVVADLGSDHPEHPEHDDTSKRLEARSTLGFALDRLDEAKREVFVLYEIEGLTMREVCEILDCPLQTAYSRLHAARKVLTDAVDSDDRGESS
jgi:RNA polymerase sigma-70 factor (ECF subfamily)